MADSDISSTEKVVALGVLGCSGRLVVLGTVFAGEGSQKCHQCASCGLRLIQSTVQL